MRFLSVLVLVPLICISVSVRSDPTSDSDSDSSRGYLVGTHRKGGVVTNSHKVYTDPHGGVHAKTQKVYTDAHGGIQATKTKKVSTDGHHIRTKTEKHYSTDGGIYGKSLYGGGLHNGYKRGYGAGYGYGVFGRGQIVGPNFIGYNYNHAQGQKYGAPPPAHHHHYNPGYPHAFIPDFRQGHPISFPPHSPFVPHGHAHLAHLPPVGHGFGGMYRFEQPHHRINHGVELPIGYPTAHPINLTPAFPISPPPHAIEHGNEFHLQPHSPHGLNLQHNFNPYAAYLQSIAVPHQHGISHNVGFGHPYDIVHDDAAYVVHAGHSGHAGYAGHAGHAGHTGHAGHGVYAKHAGHAGHAGHTGHAEHAVHAGHVGHAGHAGHAGYAGHGHAAHSVSFQGLPQYSQHSVSHGAEYDLDNHGHYNIPSTRQPVYSTHK